LSKGSPSLTNRQIRTESILRLMIREFLQFWKQYRKNRAGVFGLVVVFYVISIAIFAPGIARNSPLALVAETFVSPSSSYPMGTDDLGRDVMSGVVFGARISLLVGFVAAATSAAIGTIVGAFAGYYGGKADEALMRISEAFQVIPQFFMALIIVALFGSGVWNVIFVIGILSWPATARLVRAEYLSIKEREFVEAARALGKSDLSIMFKEVFPNAAPPLIVNSSLQLGNAILMEAGLSFLGLGDPNNVSWGYMLHNAQRFLRQAWWMAAFPGVAIFFMTLALNLVGDGLNDALNPKLKER